MTRVLPGTYCVRNKDYPPHNIITFCGRIMPEDGEEHYFYDIYNAYDHYRFSKEDEDYASPCRKCSHEITKTADPDGYLENN